MPKLHIAAITALTAACLFAITGCDSKTNSGESGKDIKPPTAKGDTKAGNLPDMTGKGLQSAQDHAQAAGFYNLASHDTLGRGRMQALDRNWKVCSQSPTPGKHPTNTKIDFGAVKLEETCPTKDQAAAPQASGSSMPDFTGKAVKVARRALHGNTSITVKDGSGQGRMVLVESNWQVCSQQPAAGAKLDGQPVTLTAVKFGETC
ncbi:hypothetical protein AB0C81_14035 [Streptomyces roseoverticillatus]|uniref:hypothetical protein n=1 Tax=Streptomyces roseoverticillatus TaxID=66429 RepID=UPI00340F8027